MDKKSKTIAIGFIAIIAVISAVVGMMLAYGEQQREYRNATKSDSMTIQQYSARVYKAEFLEGDIIRVSWKVSTGHYAIILLLDSNNYEKQAQQITPATLYYGNKDQGSFTYQVNEDDTYYLEIMSIQYYTQYISVQITYNQNFELEGTIY